MKSPQFSFPNVPANTRPPGHALVARAASTKAPSVRAQARKGMVWSLLKLLDAASNAYGREIHTWATGGSRPR